MVIYNLVIKYHQEIFDEDAPPLEPIEVKERFDKAYEYVSSWMISPSERIPIVQDIVTYREVGFKRDCDIRSLKIRLLWGESTDVSPNLHAYIEHYNEEVFEECAMKLNKTLTKKVKKFRKEDYIHLHKLSQMIRERGVVLANGDDDNVRGLSVVAIDYLEELGLDIEKSSAKSMFEHTTWITGLLNRVFFDECHSLGEQFEAEDTLYGVFLDHDLNLRDLFDDQVLRLFEKLNICQHFTYASRYVYPLGRYDLPSLIDQILSTSENPNDELASPERIRESLEASLFVGQAELYLDNDYSIVMRRFVDLLVVSQIDENKCETRYLQAVIDLRERQSGYAILLSYLNHYIRLQLKQCFGVLENQLENVIPFRLDDTKDVENLAMLYNEFMNVATQLHANTELYMKIPYTITRLVSERLLANQGINIYDIDENPSDTSRKLTIAQKKIESLFDTCHRLIGLMRPQVDLFKLFIELDSQMTGQMTPSAIEWFTKNNICETLVGLTRRVSITS